MTDLQKRVLQGAPVGTWFIVADLVGLGVAPGAAGSAVRHMATKLRLLDRKWAERNKRFNKRVWAYKLNEHGRRMRQLLEHESA